MKKIIILILSIFTINHLSSQNTNENDLVLSLKSNSKTYSKLISDNISKDNLDIFYSELESCKSTDDLNSFSLKHFSEENSNTFKTSYGNFIESLVNLAKLNKTKEELNSIFIANNQIDPDVFYCRNRAGYDQCMTPVFDASEDALIDYVIETGISIIGVVFAPDNITASLAGVAGLNAARKFNNSRKNFEKDRSNCFDTYCK